jgi:putative ABC transport system substrate-binding protein
MNRRGFISLLGGAAAWPIGAGAQRSEPLRRGALIGSAESDPVSAPRVAALERGLAELGWVTGRNLAIDYRWAAGDPAQMEALARELVQLKPDVLVASTTPVVAALRREAGAIPIILWRV